MINFLGESRVDGYPIIYVSDNFYDQTILNYLKSKYETLYVYNIGIKATASNYLKVVVKSDELKEEVDNYIKKLRKEKLDEIGKNKLN